MTLRVSVAHVWPSVGLGVSSAAWIEFQVALEQQHFCANSLRHWVWVDTDAAVHWLLCCVFQGSKVQPMRTVTCSYFLGVPCTWHVGVCPLFHCCRSGMTPALCMLYMGHGS
jgi:hypothetical protein